MFATQQQFKQSVDQVIERNQSISEMKTNIAKLQDGQKGMRSDIAKLQDGQKEMRSDIAKLQDGQKEMKSDIAKIQGGLNELKSEMSKIQINIEQMQHHMGLMLENISTTLGLYPMVDYNKLTIEEVKSRTEAIKAALQTHIRNRKMHLVNQ